MLINEKFFWHDSCTNILTDTSRVLILITKQKKAKKGKGVSFFSLLFSHTHNPSAIQKAQLVTLNFPRTNCFSTLFKNKSKWLSNDRKTNEMRKTTKQNASYDSILNYKPQHQNYNRSRKRKPEEAERETFLVSTKSIQILEIFPKNELKSRPNNR